MDSETLIKETHELTVQWYKEQKENAEKEKVHNGIVLVVFVGMFIVSIVSCALGFYAGYNAGVDEITKKFILLSMGIDL